MGSGGHVLLHGVPPDGASLGYVRARGRDYPIQIIGPICSPACRVDVGAELAELLRGSEVVVAQRLAQSRDVSEFIIELAEVVEQLPAAELAANLPSQAYYAHLLGELDAIGWQLLADVSESLDALQLALTDAAGRVHECWVRLPHDYPASAPEARFALPLDFDIVWPAAAGASRFRLATLVEQLSAELGRHQRTWDLLDDIDAHTAVLEPQAPTRDQCSRRIAFGRHSSLQLRLNPHSPDALPEIAFFGAEVVVAPLRARLNERLGLWNARRTVRENLQEVLEIQFPRPSAAAAEEFSIECGICYTYRLEGVIPQCACDGCSQVFHHSCLLEWLQALPNCQQSFDSVFGSCPYCSKPIATHLHQR
ncbi:hypothetical protein KFE25_009502 [Diacronema lutheri]|uniref:RING-type domain-containing protein n=1 Tax=Diacronema lutheri TaxID=2081491 RepID=A0A8J6CHE9_DIALT|nr:hypothetical protein KFE25_009502 [Diacronema lutheri]